MSADGRDLITHSRSQCAKTCLRKHHYAYNLGLRRERASQPLRMGAAFHKGKELLRKGVPAAEALEEAIKPYENVPDGCDPLDWAIEREKVFRLLHAYLHIYVNDALIILCTERPFKLPLINPETGHASTRFKLGGKIDGIVMLPDGRLAVDETKTTGQSIEFGSDYWAKIQTVDEQITRYMYAARALGYEVACVHYDVIRKPGIAPKQIPLLDESGCKVVLDADGKRVMNKNGTPKQSGSTEQGWTLQSRIETATEYGDRLTQDIFERPQFYFCRKEITRTDADIQEWVVEQWQQQKLLAECENTGRHFKNTSACLMPYRCEFADVCFSGGYTPGQTLPQGFRLVDNVHPELEEEGD